MPNILREITPERLGEHPPGHPDYDPDLDCTKFRVISEKMQEDERTAEKKLHNQFVDEPIKDPESRTMFLIPKTNLRIPYKWFDNVSDAATFIRVVARANNVGVQILGKSATGTSLRMFIDVVWKHRHLRMKKEEDPPRMSLQERRIRHWKAVMEESCIAKHFTLRLVRHVTLMLVGASLDFAKSNATRSKSNDLSGKIEKLCEWFEEYDPEDLKAFKFLQSERKGPRDPKPNGMSRSSSMVQIPTCMVNKTVSLDGPQSRRRGQAPGEEKSKFISHHGKRKADEYDPPNFRSKRQRLTLPPLATPCLGDEIELPERKRRKRD